MVQSYICRMAESIVTIVLPQCMTATSQIVATIDVYVVAGVPDWSHQAYFSFGEPGKRKLKPTQARTPAVMTIPFDIGRIS